LGRKWGENRVGHALEKTGNVPAIDMKNSSSTTILIGVLAMSVLASVVLCWLYIHNAGELRNLQINAAGINNRRAAITALANDAMEYSQKNPAIIPILEAAGIKTSKAASTTTNKPTK
jgi:hypothetical protein